MFQVSYGISHSESMSIPMRPSHIGHRASAEASKEEKAKEEEEEEEAPTVKLPGFWEGSSDSSIWIDKL